ncbi:hypothetical protein ABBQ38_008425 [Trebouxia sp. C0009 RCD-2024]
MRCWLRAMLMYQCSNMGGGKYTTVEDPSRHRLPVQPPGPHTWLGSGLPQAMGIFAVALSGPSGSALPTLRGTMKQPLHFKRVLLVALGAMTGVYALMGSVGYFYFGSEASQLITADLETKSVLSHLRVFGVIRFDKLVSALIGVHAFTVLGPQVLVLQKMLAAIWPKGSTEKSWEDVACMPSCCSWALGACWL